MKAQKESTSIALLFLWSRRLSLPEGRAGNRPETFKIAILPVSMPIINAVSSLVTLCFKDLIYFAVTLGKMVWVVNATPRPICHRSRALVPILQNVLWVPRQVWMGAKNLAQPTGIRSPNHPAPSESLHRLSYPGPHLYPFSSLNLQFFTKSGWTL